MYMICFFPRNKKRPGISVPGRECFVLAEMKKREGRKSGSPRRKAQGSLLLRWNRVLLFTMYLT